MEKTGSFISLLFSFALMTWMPSPLMSQVNQAEKIYEEGVYQLEATGNFDEAIKLFSQVVEKYPAEKSIAAKALFKLGLCYERQGNQKAIETYEQIIREYPDQGTLVTQAKDRLVALHKGNAGNLTVSRLVPADIYIECQTLSPDGTKVAGISWNDGQNVAVYDLVSGSLDYITDYTYGKQSCSTYGPVWAPDGNELVHYVWCWGGDADEEPQLRITNLNGESRLLYKCDEYCGITPCDWLPDQSAVLAVIGTEDGIFRLVMISTDDGSLREVCTIENRYRIQDGSMFEAAQSASVSPDGKYIALADGPWDQKKEIYIIDLTNGTKTQLTNHPGEDREPRWSPDSKYIAFKSNRNGSWALWGMPVRDGQSDGKPFMILEGMEDQELGPWTDNGLCTRTMASASEIYTLELDPTTHEVTGQPKIVETEAIGNSSFPLWSPDGRYLSYRSYYKDENSLYLVFVPMAGGETKKYKSDYPVPPVGGTFQWIPDGSGIGAIFWDKDINLYFSKLDPDKGAWDTKQVTTGDFKGLGNQIAWSRDGKAFYFIRMDENTQDISVVRHELDTGREEALYTYQRGESMEYSWWKVRASNDGKYLAFNMHHKIGLLDIETGEIKELSYDNENNFVSPTWSPDDNYLLVKAPHAEGEDVNELYIVSVADGSYKSLDISQYLPRGARLMISNEWSPDGKMIVFDIRTWKSETNLIQNIIQRI